VSAAKYSRRHPVSLKRTILFWQQGRWAQSVRDKEEIDFEFFFTDSFKRSDLVVVCHSACDAGTGNFVVVSDEFQ
jgi:hypothetical protein